MKLPFAKHTAILKEYMGPYKSQTAMVCTLIILNVGLQIYNPRIIRNYLDAVTNVADVDVLTRAAIIFIIIALIQEVIYIINVYLSVDLAWKVTNDLRLDLTRHCFSLDMTFHNRYKPGQMIERLDGDVNALSNFFSVFALMIFSNMLLLTGVLIALFIENLIVGIAFTILTIIALISMYKIRSVSVKQWTQAREETSELMGFIEEQLAGTEEIRPNDGIENVYRNFHNISKKEYNQYNTAVFKSRMSTVLSFSIMAIGSTMV